MLLSRRRNPSPAAMSRPVLLRFLADRSDFLGGIVAYSNAARYPSLMSLKRRSPRAVWLAPSVPRVRLRGPAERSGVDLAVAMMVSPDWAAQLSGKRVGLGLHCLVGPEGATTEKLPLPRWPRGRHRRAPTEAALLTCCYAVSSVASKRVSFLLRTCWCCTPSLRRRSVGDGCRNGAARIDAARKPELSRQQPPNYVLSSRRSKRR